MNRGEKRSFKLFANRYKKDNSLYLRLFEVLDKQDGFDETKLKNKVFSHAREMKQLPVLKNQLFNLLLQSLRVSKGKKVPLFRTNVFLESYEILMERGMFNEAVRYLEKAETAAISSENYPMQLSVLDHKKNVYQRTMDPDHLNLKMDSISKRKKRITELLDKEEWFANMHHQVYRLYRLEGIAATEEVKQKYLSFAGKLIQKENDIPSIKAHHFYFLSQTIIHYSISDIKKGIAFAEQHIDLMRNNRFFLETHMNEYLKALNNIITMRISMKDFQEAKEEILLLESLNQESGNMNVFLEQRIFEIGYTARLAICVQGIRIDEGLDMAKEIKKGLKKYGNSGLSVDRNMRLSFGMALLFFWKENWDKCLDWLADLDKIELQSGAGPAYIGGYARILSLICHYELGHHELMESLIRGCRRYLVKNKRFLPTEEFLIKHINKLNTSPKKKEWIYSQMKSGIVEFKEKEPESLIFSSLRIDKWIESKISGKKLEKLLI